jgi:hypothetical protein
MVRIIRRPDGPSEERLGYELKDGFRFPTGERRDLSRLRNFHTDSGALPGSYSITVGRIFLWCNASWAWNWPLTWVYFFMARQSSGPWLLRCQRFSVTFKHTTLCTIPLDEWSADLTTFNTHKRQTSMGPAGFEPAVSVSERPETDFLDRMVTSVYYWG